jgi:hypothetical protein
MLICYENSILISMQTIAPDEMALENALNHPVLDESLQDPGILACLTQENWAN